MSSVLSALCILGMLFSHSGMSDSCDPMDCSPPGSSVHGISQARILEWAAISSSRGIFPTRGLNLCLLCVLHWPADSLPLSHLGRHISCVLWPIIRKTLRKLRLRECIEFPIVTHMKMYKGLKLIVTLS